MKELIEACEALIRYAPEVNGDGQFVYECEECGWKGTEGDMLKTDGFGDRTTSRPKPIGACPGERVNHPGQECRWWFAPRLLEPEAVALARKAIAKAKGGRA